MAKALKYNKPPITEALIDLRVQPQPNCSFDKKKLIKIAENSGYNPPEVIFQKVAEVKFQAGQSTTASAQQSPIGYKFTNNVDNYVLQMRVDGFTLSHLNPYKNWRTLRSEAKKLWPTYQEQINPRIVTRLAVRYINRIDIPAKNVELKEYFRTGPEISPELPQSLDGFFMQLRIPYVEINSHLVLNQTIMQAREKEIISVLLDIDIFRNMDVPESEKEIWLFFEKLHDQKNRVFESCITDKTRELFK